MASELERWFGRPLWLLALLLLVGLTWFLAARWPARIDASGTLRWWSRRELAPAKARAGRGRLPPEVRWIGAALALGVLALARPGPKESTAPVGVNVVLSRAPSMALPAASRDAAGAVARPETRMDVARTRAQAWIAEMRARYGPLDVRWVDPACPGADVRGAQVEQDWLVQRTRAASAEEWAGYDEEFALWIADVLPSEPLRADAIALGAQPTSGAVALEQGRRWVWNGREIEPAAPPHAAMRVVFDLRLGVELLEVVRSWCEARGLTLDTKELIAPSDRARLAREGVLLVLRALGTQRAHSLALGERGWRAEGERLRPEVGEAATAVHGERRAWLADRDAGELVWIEPGLIEFAWRPLAAPEGDAADVAVAFAQRLESALLAPPDVIEIGARTLEQRPSEQVDYADSSAAAARRKRREDGSSRFRASAVLALAAAVCAAMGLTSIAKLHRPQE